MRIARQPTAHSATSAPFSRVLPALLWLASVVGLGVSSAPGFGGARIVAALASLLFIGVLIKRLVHEAPHARDLPDLTPLVAPRLGFWGLAFAIGLGLALVLALGLFVGAGASVLLVACLVALMFVINWRDKLPMPMLLVGLAAGLLVGLGIALVERGQFAWALLNAVATPPLFAAGALLMRRSGLGQVRLLAGQGWWSLRSFAWGCALALPAAILNLLGNLQGRDAWVAHWWQPLAALDPAIAEEIWARLFLTTLMYALLRPVSNNRPGRALAVAVLLSALAHAFAHSGINPIGLVIGGLLYGVPAGLLFVKRDLEHAIGYHFLIDCVRYLAALI
jgi:hypothetical protein